MYSICLNHALSGYLGYFQFFPVTSHAVCAHLSFYGHYKIAFKKSRYGLQQCMKRKSLHIFTETQQSLLIFVNLAGKKKSLRHFVCYIYLQLSYFNIFDIFICLLISVFLPLLEFPSLFLSAWQDPSETSWGRIGHMSFYADLIHNCWSLRCYALQCVWLFFFFSRVCVWNKCEFFSDDIIFRLIFKCSLPSGIVSGILTFSISFVLNGFILNGCCFICI